MKIGLTKLCQQYVLVNSWGKESGDEKSQIHTEISKYLARQFSIDENAIHHASQDITDNLDYQIGLPKYREIGDKEIGIFGQKLEEKLVECVKSLKGFG